VNDLVTGHAYQPAPPEWDWGDHCTWFDTTPPVPPHPVMCHQPERCHASVTEGLPPVPSGFYEAGEPRHRAERWQRAIRDDPANAYQYARDCYTRTGTEADKEAMLACAVGEKGGQP
jgi:hypothetical protein